jgi:hypothetical protein
MQVASTAPQISRGLLAVGPDVAKILAAVLRKASLYNYIDDNMVKTIQLEYCLRFYVFC